MLMKEVLREGRDVVEVLWIAHNSALSSSRSCNVNRDPSHGPASDQYLDFLLRRGYFFATRHLFQNLDIHFIGTMCYRCAVALHVGVRAILLEEARPELSLQTWDHSIGRTNASELDMMTGTFNVDARKSCEREDISYRTK